MATVYDKNTPFCGECEHYWGTADGNIICLYPGSMQNWKEDCPKYLHMEERCSGCAYITAGDNGEWLCCGEWCGDVPDSDCPVMRKENE